LVGPAASVAEVAFSAGGTGALVTLTRAGKTFTLSWPGVLPAPAVAGDSATYAEVLPGVDMVVRATHSGFTHVLVVKTAKAAANPALRGIRLGVGGDARISGLPDGSLRAVAGDTVLASAAPAAMWDSNRTLSSGAIGGDGPAGAGADVVLDPSTAAAAGDAARTARVETDVTATGDLLLTPDVRLLTDADMPRRPFSYVLDVATGQLRPA
jgi:hypothetical protein